MEIKTVAVLGAGAVGSYIIWGLDKKVKLGVIGEGERAKRLQKGCLINDQMYYPEVWSPTEAHGVGLHSCLCQSRKIFFFYPNFF